MVSRPKRRATNAHIFRYLQTRNPIKLEENDLKRALEASLEECPDFWPEETASCSSSEQSNATSSADSTSGTSSTSSCNVPTSRTNTNRGRFSTKTSSSDTKGRRKSSMQQNHLANCHHANNHNLHNHQHNQQHSHNSPTSHQSNTANSNHCSCPLAPVHNRYKPVAKKNIYKEADFFHDGIMQYIEYALLTDPIEHKRLKK